jgi:hypothetical protein
MSRAFVLLLFLLALSHNSFAGEKWIITSITPLTEVYVKHMDNRHLDHEGRIKNWTRTEYNRDESVLAFMEYDCDDRKSRVIELIDKSEDKTEYISDESKEWVTVIPESIDDAVLRYVCEAVLP